MHLPKFDVPEGKTAVSYLRELAEAGLKGATATTPRSCGRGSSSSFGTIEEMGFPDYFLIVWDFVRFAREDRVSVGPGRGSAAGSLVTYCLRITDLDPMRYSLLFERFLDPGRESCPTSTSTSQWRAASASSSYVAEKYGRHNVAQIITFGKMRPKAAVKDAGRVMGSRYGQVDRIAKLIPTGPRSASTSA